MLKWLWLKYYYSFENLFNWLPFFMWTCVSFCAPIYISVDQSQQIYQEMQGILFL